MTTPKKPSASVKTAEPSQIQLPVWPTKAPESLAQKVCIDLAKNHDELVTATSKVDVVKVDRVSLPAGTMRKVRVDQAMMKGNLKNEKAQPVFTVTDPDGTVRKMHSAEIMGPSMMIYEEKREVRGCSSTMNASAYVTTNAEIVGYIIQ